MSLEYQEKLLKDINKDLLSTNSNLKNANTGVINQGEQIDKIQGHLNEAGQNIRQTDRTMMVIEWRAKCYKFSLYIVIVLEILTIIVLLLRKIFK